MQKETNTHNMNHWILAGALILTGIFLIVALVVINSQADNVSTQTTISNTAPAVDSVFVSNSAGAGTNDFAGGIPLTVNGGKTVHINGVVSDANGKEDIGNNAIQVTFYRSGVTNGPTCTPNQANCYNISGGACTVTDATSTTRNYTCPINLQFNAESTSASGTFAAENWLAKVTVTDTAGPAAANLTHGGVEVNTLLGLLIPNNINFGTLGLNATTTNANNAEQTVTQAGNIQADVEVSSAAAMNCSGAGTIPVANQKWALTDVGHADGAATALSGTPADTNLGVLRKVNDGTPETKTLYWNIAIPANGVSGNCTGTTVINAIAG